MLVRERQLRNGNLENLYDSTTVRALFDEMSLTYGLVNLIASFGFAVRWRHQAVKNLYLSKDAHIVDLMSGMNELCRSISKYSAKPLHVTAVDFSSEMVHKARMNWPFTVTTHLADVFEWDFLPSSADAVMSSFGLKTFDDARQRELASRVASLLRPAGVFSFVEISVPPARPLQWLYMFYLARVIPWIGRLCLGNPENYRKLALYTRGFKNCRKFAAYLREEGLEVVEINYFFGCATGVRGYKPAR